MKKIISLLLSAILVTAMFGISASARVLGDVNGDKAANSVDALKILLYSVGSDESISPKLADVNCDGRVNSVDALIVLNISVGDYNGPTTVEYKVDVVDPILKTGKFTLSTIVATTDENGKPTKVPTTIMVDGKNMCVSMKVSGIDTRLLVLNGKAYMVFPLLKAYMEMSNEEIGDLDFGNINTGADETYIGSSFVKEGNKTYTVDSYKSSDGSVIDYYFLNGKWTRLVVTDGSTKESQEITDFKAGVNSSYFSLKGYTEIDPSTLG